MIFVYLLLIGVPILLIFVTITKIIKVKSIEQHGIKTNAVVTHIRPIRSGRNWSDKLTLEYKDNRGTSHSAKATTVKGHLKAGNTMSLKYSNNKPSAYSIDGTQKGDWVLLIVWILLLAYTIYASFKIDEMIQSGYFG